MEKEELKFQNVYNEFYEKILRFLENMAGKSDAEDLTQEVFLKVNKSLGDFQGKSKLSTWIYRIATNTALDRLRSPSFRQSHQTQPIGTSPDCDESNCATIQIQDKAPSASHTVEKNDMEECVRAFIDQLPPGYRAVIELSDLNEFKDQEIAEILGISLEAAKIRLHRARARLKNMLERGCDFYYNEMNEFSCDRKSCKSSPQKK